jgi:transcriptional regulator with XRE-family HTH domain
MSESGSTHQLFVYRVRRRRQVLGKSQRAIAQAIGMQPSQYSRLESGGNRLMDTDQLKRLAEALETTTDYLLGLSDEAGPVPPDLCPQGALSVAGVTPLATITLLGEDA